jgi:hypothetical protein
MNDLNLIIKSRDLAISSHRRINQLYDGLPYYIHLQETVDFVYMFEHLLKENEIDIAICTAWLHDVVEDTGLTFNNIKKIVGDRIASLSCNLCNNIHGKTRDERANDDYYDRLKSDKISVFVKIADRLANMYHSLNYGNNSMFETYSRELIGFKEKLYNGMYDEMWEFLENIENMEIKKNIYFPDIDNFDENTIFNIHLPKPIPYGLFHEMYNKGIIPKKNLKKNTYYRGKCRNASVALWNGFEFIYVREKFGSTFNEEIKHPEDDDGYDLFIPLEIEKKKPDEHLRIKY